MLIFLVTASLHDKTENIHVLLEKICRELQKGIYEDGQAENTAIKVYGSLSCQTNYWLEIYFGVEIQQECLY